MKKLKDKSKHVNRGGIAGRPEWLGSPSSSAHLSFSSVANRHIRNLQDLPGYDPTQNPVFDPTRFAPKVKKYKRATLIAKKAEKARLRKMEEGFVGNPHSHSRLSFSSTVNKILHTRLSRIITRSRKIFEKNP